MPDFDLFYITRGRLAFVWPDGARFALKPGDFGLIPPLTPLRIDRIAGNISYWFCHFNFRLGPEHYSLRMKDDYWGPAPEVQTPVVFASRQAPGVMRAFRKLTALRFDGPRPPWRYEAALLEVIGELKFFAWRKARHEPPGQLHAPVANDARLAAVLHKIQTEPQRAWSVVELAHGVGLSTDRLNIISARLTRRSIKEHIIRARFEKAFAMLRPGSEGERPSIKEVSRQCGFQSQHYFCRQFKRLFHLTPSEFREQTIVT